MKTIRHWRKTLNTRRRKDRPCLWISRIYVVKMDLLPESIYRFNAISIKILMTFFTKIEKQQYKNWHKVHKAILSKKRNAGAITSDFKLYYRAIATRTAWYRYKNRHADQWNRKPRNKPLHLQPSDSQQQKKVPKNIHWRKDTLFNKVLGKLSIHR
jgi:hypothetical protein